MEAAAAGRDAAPDAMLAAALDAATGRRHLAGRRPTAAGRRRRPHRRRATDAPRARSVQVVIRADAVMRGARAVLAVRRAEAAGSGVAACGRPLVQLEREEFDGRLGFRIESPAGDEELAAAIRSAGEVDAVRFEEPVAAETSGAERHRQIRVDLGRLDRLMKQVGELVVAEEPARRDGGARPTIRRWPS